ncbi:hypothetical protein ACFOOK_14080 [Micromonospora krabiensis]|uniref:hypothetical protein n=1 Tax=Micromonospora krabiensis TaxID=307121 RepID=UPI0012FDB91B|nr:hypothetical protein [Micromonospora krabiensis]
MVVHIHDGNSPAVAADSVVPHLPAAAPVFVDATGRRARLMRWCGVLLAAVALVYVPIVGLAVLTGPPADRSAPLLDEEAGLATGDQPAAPDLPLDRAIVDDLAGSDLPPPDHAPEAVARPIPVPAPGPADPVPARPPEGSTREPSPPSPSTVGPTQPSESPSPSGAAPSPSPQTPPPLLVPNAAALLDAQRRP